MLEVKEISLLERIPEEKIFLTIRTNDLPSHNGLVGTFLPSPQPVEHYHVYIMKGFNLVEYVVGGNCDCTDDTLALEVLEAKND